jgi:hypothetical protein
LIWADFTKLFDSYNRVARIYPAAVAFAPVIWTTAAFGLVPDVKSGLVAMLVFGCVLYFFASLARSRGKALEPVLIIEWGAWPTTLFLRHRDNHFDKKTKGRYHSALAKLSKLRFPTPDEEEADQEGADETYRSATKRLIEARRESKYKMLHDENASYGFRRNLLGLKPVALLIGVVAAVATGIAWWVGLPQPVTMPSAFVAFKAAPLLVILVLLDVAYVVLIASFVTRPFVFQAGAEYSDALFKTLDAPTT